MWEPGRINPSPFHHIIVPKNELRVNKKPALVEVKTKAEFEFGGNCDCDGRMNDVCSA